MDSLKPLGSRVISVEKAMRIVDNTPGVPNKVAVPQYSGDTVYFHGYKLVREEYDALESIAQNYFGKSAEEYFINVREVSKDVRLQISDTHVISLAIKHQQLRKIPEEIGSLVELRHLYLGMNQIERIENVDHLERIRQFDIDNNPIDYSLPHNQREYEKMRKKIGIMLKT